MSMAMYSFNGYSGYDVFLIQESNHLDIPAEPKEQTTDIKTLTSLINIQNKYAVYSLIISILILIFKD